MQVCCLYICAYLESFGIYLILLYVRGVFHSAYFRLGIGQMRVFTIKFKTRDSHESYYCLFTRSGIYAATEEKNPKKGNFSRMAVNDSTPTSAAYIAADFRQSPYESAARLIHRTVFVCNCCRFELNSRGSVLTEGGGRICCRIPEPHLLIKFSTRSNIVADAGRCHSIDRNPTKEHRGTISLDQRIGSPP